LRNRFVEYERSEIIGRTSIDKRASEKARRWNQAIDRLLEEQREHWWTVPSPPMLITLHADAGNLPGGILLRMDHDVSISAIRKRAATLTGDFNAVPEAILENVEHGDMDVCD